MTDEIRRPPLPKMKAEGIEAKVALMDDLIYVLEQQRKRMPYNDDIPMGVLLDIMHKLEIYVNPIRNERIIKWSA